MKRTYSKNREKTKIQKSSGDQVFFEEEKLRRSLKHSGANDQVISQIINEVSDLLYEGITTREIHNMAFALLQKSSHATAARYKLKRAIYELGPTGFPFEKFIGEILKHEGFQVQINVLVEGLCVNHEIDAIAKKNESYFLVECKFHSYHKRYCDVKVPLYILSRFNDIKQQWLKAPSGQTKFQEGWIFTNTRFTSDAIQFGNCSGLKLIGWNYPENDSLNKRIDTSGLHPITCLTTLTKREKESLLEKAVVLCKDIHNNGELLYSIGISINRHKRILNEVSELCNIIR